MSAGRGGSSLSTGQIAAILVLVAAVLGAVALSRAGGPPHEMNPGSYSAVLQGVCDSASLVRAGEPEAARDAFYARAHTGLHLVAAALTEVDRPLTAELLRSKNAVEQDFDGFDPDLAGSLDTLGLRLQMALESLGAPHSSCAA